MLEEAMAKLVTEREELDSRREAAEIARENTEVQLQDLAEALETSERNLQLVEAAEVALRGQLEDMTVRSAKVAAAHDEELRRVQSESDELRRQVALLRDTTAVGAKQAEVEELVAEREDIAAAMRDLRAELETAALERDALAERLVELDRGIGAEVEQRVVAERETNLTLERKLRAAEMRLAQEIERAAAQESERRLLTSEVDELSRWKAVYESGHGLQELSRSQRKVKEDNRRLGVALEQVTRRLGEAIDGNALLLQALERLKRETGRHDFVFDEAELRREMLGENAGLRAQVLELEAQIEALEAEAVRVRRALKNQAGALGEQGFRFAGMDAEMLVRVNEFASALREGREVPAEPRASELLKENRRLREELAALRLRTELLEREGGGLADPLGAGEGAAQEALLRGLREDVRRVFDENGELRSRLARMQDEVLGTIGRQTTELSGGATDGIAAMLIANNEILLRQIHELKLQVASQVSRGDPPELDGVSVAEAQSAAPHIGSPFVDSLRRSRGLPPQGRRPLVAETPPRPLTSRSAMFGDVPATPYTESGKALLSRTLAGLNLPPEEWADEVRDLNGQLVECIETLFEREAELNEQSAVARDLERNLVRVKQQLAALYLDYGRRKDEWSAVEKQLRSESIVAGAERDDLRLKLRRAEETIALLQKEDPDSIESKLRELSRKLAVYEVNEAVLSRRYTAQKEQLESELQRRQELELEGVNIETGLKRRILYLEQAKSVLGGKVDRLEALIGRNVPADDFRALQGELEALRESHLETLRREVESRVRLLRMNEDAAGLSEVRARLQRLELELAASHDACDHLRRQLDEQRALTQRAASAASPDLARITADATRYRMEVSRLEVELAGARRDVSSLSDDLDAAVGRERQLMAETADLRRRAEMAASLERDAKQALSELRLRFEGGLTKDEADQLRFKSLKSQTELDLSRLEIAKLKELTDIAVTQATAVSRTRQQTSDELSELMDYCSRIESKGDDELIIGRLQRQLSSTKTSYRMFASKYHALRSDMHQRELVIRAMERRLDERDAEAFALRRNHNQDLSILRKALHHLETGPGSSPNDAGSGGNLVEISRKVASFSQLADVAVSHALELEEQKRQLAGALQDLELERAVLGRRCDDLAMVVSADEKKRELARRLVDLSEEARSSMLKLLQSGREVSVLGQEKRYLQAVVATLESNLKELAEMKMRGAGLLSAEQPVELLPDQDSRLSALQELLYKDPLLPDNSNLLAKVNELNGRLSSEELLARLQSAGEKVVQVKREAEDARARGDLRVAELERTVASQAETIERYENLLRSEGICPEERWSAESRLPKQVDTHGILRAEQARVQEAASATIGSLRALLAEKNETIDRLRDRLEHLDAHRPRSHADRNAEALLAEKENLPDLAGDFPGASPADSAFQRRLLGQIEEAEGLIEERNKTIAQLEAQLARHSNARERAEVRCGEAIAEMEAMKGDMVRLVQQLREAQAGRGRLDSTKKPLSASEAEVPESKDGGQDAEVPTVRTRDQMQQKDSELRKALRAKDEKIRGYREIIVRLKDEFIKAEEERALLLKKQEKDRGGKEPSSSLAREEMVELKAQVVALKDGLRTAKEDLEAAKKTREKLTRARLAAQEEQEKMDAQLSRAEAQAASALDSLARVRKELEESRRKEAQLRSKLKEVSESGVGDGALSGRLQAMGREIELLKAQNEALRKETSGRRERTVALPLRSFDPPEAPPKAEARVKEMKDTFTASEAKEVREAREGPQTATLESKKTALVLKSEGEKRIEKRLATLEMRLKEKTTECEDLQRQMAKLREAAQSATPKERRTREEGRPGNVELVVELEESRRRVFELEDANTALRRRCEVELQNEIAELRHQLSASRQEMAELASVQETKGVAGARAEGGRSLRERYTF